MYIHSYQIHNVLNVYRKQLSQDSTRINSGFSARRQTAQDRINISFDGQRQSLFDKISSEIVDRITRFEPESKFEATASVSSDEADIKEHAADPGAEIVNAGPQDTAFKYTLINEHNQKITHSLPIGQFSLSEKDMESVIEKQKDNDVSSGSE